MAALLVVLAMGCWCLWSCWLGVAGLLWLSVGWLCCILRRSRTHNSPKLHSCCAAAPAQPAGGPAALIRRHPFFKMGTLIRPAAFGHEERGVPHFLWNLSSGRVFSDGGTVSGQVANLINTCIDAFRYCVYSRDVSHLGDLYSSGS